MCGIFAYINYGVPIQQKAVIEKLLNGLRRLEYRGYDSAGIAVDNGPSVHELSQEVMKATGKIDRLAELVRVLRRRTRRASHATHRTYPPSRAPHSDGSPCQHPPPGCLFCGRRANLYFIFYNFRRLVCGGP